MRPGFSVRPPAPLRRFLCAIALFLVAGAGVSLAQDPCVGFVQRTVAPGGTNGAASVFSIDIDMDSDGDLDVLSASFNDDLIAWHENRAGDGSDWVMHVISRDADGAMSVFAADINGDGHMDVLSASAYDNTIAWYQNIGSDPPAFIKRAITRGAVHAQSVFAADLDGDGDTDVLAASFLDGTFSWFENLLEQDPVVSFTEHVISSDSPGASSIAAAYVDADTQMDVVAASYLTDTVAWYKGEWIIEIGEDGSRTPVLIFNEHVITTTAAGVKSVSPADLDGDGDVDLASAWTLDDTVAWHENRLNEDPPVWDFRPISTEAHGVKSVYAAATDDEVVLLAAATEDDAVIWYEQDAGSASGFDERARVEDVLSVDAVFAADVDGDGDIDALSASSVPGPISAADSLAWYENDEESPALLTQWPISGTAVGARSLDAGDLDGDGDLDVASAGGAATIGWHENLPEADPHAWEFHAIPGETAGARSVFVANVDAVGEPDIVVAFESQDKIAWFENEGGDPPTFAERLISDALDGPTAVFAVDLDLDTDGHLDVVSASFEDDTIAWHENTAGNGSDWVMHVISTEADGAMSVFAADFNNDGFTDVLSASFNDDTIAWYKNTAGDGSDWVMHIIASDDLNEAEYGAGGVSHVVAADLDDDEDMDVIAAVTLENGIAWFENDVDPDDPLQRIFTPHVITSVTTLIAWVATADVDGDGDIDVLSASPGNDLVAWYENDGETTARVHGSRGDKFGAEPARGDRGGLHRGSGRGRATRSVRRVRLRENLVRASR